MTTSKAEDCLQEMHDEVNNEKSKSGSCTLAYWRLSNPDILKALQDFCAAPDWASVEKDYKDEATLKCCSEEVQLLFSKLNQAMVEQEQSLLWPQDNLPTPEDNQWSIVFGGKWSASPISISEKLVGLLAAKSGSRVYTVSRTAISDNHNNPSTVQHFAVQNLDSIGGHEEFEQVMNHVVDDYEKNVDGLKQQKCPIVFYFTLGQHKGSNAFQRNIIGAENFSQALRNVVNSRLGGSNGIKVVLTGTDATNPSTKEDTVLQVDGVTTSVPTYKIMPYNFVYAASKLGQFYTVAAAVAELTNIIVQPLRTGLNGKDEKSLSAVAEQIEKFIQFAGDNGTYRENGILSNDELDAISNHWTDVVEDSLRGSLSVAKGISICYTPLHRDPWTRASFQNCDKESEGSPKAYMIQQIVRRFKNAISIDRAARAHL